MEQLTIPPELLSDPERVALIISVGQLNSLLESGHITTIGAALLCHPKVLHLLEMEPQPPISYTKKAKHVLAALENLWSTYKGTHHLPQSKTLNDRSQCLLGRAMTNLTEFLFWETQH